MAAICCPLFEWWCTASATVLSQGVGSLEIRHLERVDVHKLPDNGVGLDKISAGTAERKRATQQLFPRPKVQSWSGWTQPKSASSSQVSRRVRGGHTANQASGESSQQPRHGCSGAGICEENVGTTTYRVEDTAESTTTVEQKIGKCEGCSAESSKESRGSEELRSLWPRL